MKASITTGYTRGVSLLRDTIQPKAQLIALCQTQREKRQSRRDREETAEGQHME